MKFSKQAAALALSLALIGTAAVPVWADADPNSASASVSVYPLTDSVRAEVKGVSIQKLSEGTRVGVIVRLYNDGTKEKRIPDYELRLRTSDGAVYTLRANSANDTSIQAKSTADLTYLTTLTRTDDISVSELAFVNINDFVYPQIKTELLALPISGRVWNAALADLADASQTAEWNDAFRIPTSISPLQYKAVEVTKVTDANGPSMLLTLLVDNPSSTTETIPGFRMDGKSDAKLFTGQRVEQGVLTLAPGEQRYIHYAVPINNDTELSAFILMTTDTFVPAARQGQSVQPIAFDTGRLKLSIPAETVTAGNGAGSTLASYTLRTPIAFDPLNKLIDEQTEISLVDLQRHENEGDGYQTVVAKFKLTNRSDRTIPLPAFQADISGNHGARYSGVRQTGVPANLMPNLSHVVSYAFTVPKTDNSSQLGLLLLDAVTAAPYKTTIASFKASPSPVSSDDLMTFYPYSVKLNDWSLGANYSVGLYSYKLKVDLSVTAEDDVVTDQGFSKFKIELQDKFGRVLGSQTVPFIGANKLIDGVQTINISNLRTEQLEFPLTVKLYESIDTPNGEAKRLVKDLQQK